MDATALPIPMAQKWFRFLIVAALVSPVALVLFFRLGPQDPCSESIAGMWVTFVLLGIPYVAMLTASGSGALRGARLLGIGYAAAVLFVMVLAGMNTFQVAAAEWPFLILILFLTNCGLIVSALVSSRSENFPRDWAWVLLLGFLGVLYIVMVLVVTGGAVGARSPIASNEASALGSLRSINIGQVQFAATYKMGGFSRTLAALGPPAKGNAISADAADMIDAVLASGNKSGYAFTYRPGPPDAQGRIVTYTLEARPNLPGPRSCRSFFTDQTGVLRHTKEQRPATVDDLPIS